MAVKKATKKAAKKVAAKPAAKQATKTIAAKKVVKKATTKVAAPEKWSAASELITARIRKLGDWRGEQLALVRKLIHEAAPAVVEEWKWMGTPVWSHDGIICTGETYKQYVKLTFAKGAKLADPKHLFNSSLTGNTRRAIDIRVEHKLDAAAFRALIRAAVAFNQANPPKSRKA